MGDGGPDGLATDHLRSCDHCTSTLAELRRILDSAHNLPQLESPPPELWGRITDELSLDPDQGEGEAPAPVTRLAERRRTARSFRGRTLAVAATIAAVIGAGVGVGGTLLLRED